jgi:hypothetical protein
MLKQSITYTDFNDTTRTEDFYFNLSKAEVAELELGVKGGLSETLKRIVAEEDSSAIIEHFKKIILLAVGQKSADGRVFMKNETIRSEFANSNAYSELFMLLATNAEEAAKFINGILPKSFDAPGTPTTPQDHLPKVVTTAPGANVTVTTGTSQTPSPTDMAEFLAWKKQQESKSE